MSHLRTAQVSNTNSSEFDTMGYESRQIDELINQVVISDISGDKQGFNASNDRLLDELIEISETNNLPVSGEGPSQERLLTSVVRLIDLKKLEVLSSNGELQDTPKNSLTSRSHRVSREDARIALEEVISREQKPRSVTPGSDIQESESRVDSKVKQNWISKLRNSGVPDEIVNDFPVEFFYRDGDPDQIDDTPISFQEWLLNNPNALIKSKIEEEEYEGPAEELVEPSKEETASWSSKLKDRINNPAVTFDSKGNAIVDESQREYNKKAVILAIGTAAVTIAGVYIGSKLGVNPFEHLNQAQDSGTSAPNALKSGGVVDPTLKSSVSELANSWTGDISSGDGVSQVVSRWFEAQGLDPTPEQMKTLIDNLIDKNLFNPDNISGLEKMDVYGGYGFASTGKTHFSPSIFEEMNRFREILEEADKV